MSDALKELGTYIEAKRPDCVLSWDVSFGELNVDVTPSNIEGFVEFLRADQNCRFLNARGHHGSGLPRARPAL
jgi:NADH-quinone oxidoreductase subunit C